MQPAQCLYQVQTSGLAKLKLQNSYYKHTIKKQRFGAQFMHIDFS